MRADDVAASAEQEVVERSRRDVGAPEVVRVDPEGLKDGDEQVIVGTPAVVGVLILPGPAAEVVVTPHLERRRAAA